MNNRNKDASKASPKTIPAAQPSAAKSPAEGRSIVSIPAVHTMALRAMMAQSRRVQLSDEVRVLIEDAAVARGLGELVGGKFFLKIAEFKS
ncbi:MAG: hypothetical protein HZC54_00830 [Verrucomicrobia bacterium]|nr:hypothetical protein [Verrucomicrobiota bacterium]